MENFEIKNLGYYHDLYVQSDTLLLLDGFENFRNKCIEIYELDPASQAGSSLTSLSKKHKHRIIIIN